MTTAASGSVSLVQAQLRLMEIAFGFVNSQAFMAAVDLGIFDVLAEAPSTSAEVARRVAIHPVACRRLLMLLVSLGLVEREGNHFRNSEGGALCSSQSAVKLGPMSRINPFYAMTARITDALRDYSPQWQQTLGVSAGHQYPLPAT